MKARQESVSAGSGQRPGSNFSASASYLGDLGGHHTLWQGSRFLVCEAGGEGVEGEPSLAGRRALRVPLLVLSMCLLPRLGLHSEGSGIHMRLRSSRKSMNGTSASARSHRQPRVTGDSL